jgi:hypothetical protein
MKPTACTLLLFVAAVAYGEWKPPENPVPDKILDEAEADATAGRYEDALAKQVWFHQNALKYSPCLTGVRLSYALSDWMSLGTHYPPALQKLKAIRDETDSNVRQGNGPAYGTFQDLASIDNYLKVDNKTYELFLWLDTNKPSVAKEVYELAQPSLVRAKVYGLCGKYLDPDSSFQRIVRNYHEDKQSTSGSMYPKAREDFAENYFSNRTATLVALLAINDRKPEADRIAAEAAKERDDPKFRSLLEKAKAGDVPAPWP